MAEINVDQKPAGRYTWAWLVLALVMLGGFFWWLSQNSTTSTVQIVESDTTAGPALAGTPVTLQDLGGGLRQYQGETIAVYGVPVASVLGTQAFWVQPEGRNPVLVKMDSLVVATGTHVSAGDTISFSATVHAMTDSVLDAWQASGGIASASQRAEAEFATSFLETIALVKGVATAAPQGGPPAGGSQGAQGQQGGPPAPRE